MILRWSVNAAADLHSVYNFMTEEWSADAAAALVENLLQAAERLASFPYLGHVGRQEGTRELIVTPYIIVYRLHSSDLVNVESVIHGARRY